jgi:hypothetical protein
MNPLYNIDLGLLKRQKLELVDLISEISEKTHASRTGEDTNRLDNLEGILSLLDAVQDYVEDNNLEK